MRACSVAAGRASKATTLYCSWLEASLLALEEDPAGAHHSDAAQHPVSVNGASTDASGGVDYK